ncbi:MAG: hypothetical protein ACFFBI_08850 [Promethearchaeota archaeon]
MPTKFGIFGKVHNNKLEIETSPNSYVFFINLDKPTDKFGNVELIN